MMRSGKFWRLLAKNMVLIIIFWGIVGAIIYGAVMIYMSGYLAAVFIGFLLFMAFMWPAIIQSKHEWEEWDHKNRLWAGE